LLTTFLMKTHHPLAEIRVEFCDNSEQCLCEGYSSSGESVPIPSVGDTFQGIPSHANAESPTYVVERRHFQIASGRITARIYGRDIQVTGGL
jgi:hypothetical protein